MATLDFNLSFARQRFFNDDPRVLRASPEGAEDVVRRHQPADRFMDELDRRMPFDYLNEFGYDLEYPGRNTGALARPSQARVSPAAHIRVGDYYYPATAGRWSVFRGLMRSSEYRAALAATAGGRNPATFEMLARPSFLGSSNRSYGLSTLLYMLPGRPLGEGGDGAEGLYLVTLVDERYRWQYQPVTLNPGRFSTWESLIAAIAAELGVSIQYSALSPAYGRPDPDSQLWANSEDVALLLDAVAYNLGRTVVRLMDGSYRLYTPVESVELSQQSRLTGSQVVRTAGGDVFQSGGKTKAGDLRTAREAVLPATVRVTFPKFINSPTPHYLDPKPDGSRWFQDGFPSVHAVDVPLRSGGPTLSGLQGAGVYCVADVAKAVYESESDAGGAPLNQSGLNALASRIAGDYLTAQVGTGLDEVYLGIVVWAPDGLHDVLWRYSQRAGGATTRVMRQVWNLAVRQMQHATPSYAPPGGGPSPALTLRSTSGTPAVGTLALPLGSSDGTVTLNGSTFFPADHRFKVTVGSEVLLLEGGSGGATHQVVARGADGTGPGAHAAGAPVTVHPRQATYNTNLIETGPGLFLAPGTHTSGGLRGSTLLAPLRSIRVESQVTVNVSGQPYYEATILDWGPQGFFVAGRGWAVPRNRGRMASGGVYEGQYAGEGPFGPLYLASDNEISITTSGGGSSGGDLTVVNFFNDTTNNYFGNVTYNLTTNNVFIFNGDETTNYIFEGPLTVCGWLFWCYETVTVTLSQLFDWTVPADPDLAAVVYRLSTGGATYLTGMRCAFPGQVVALVNPHASADLIVEHESLLSLSSNRFTLEGGTDMVVGPRGMRLFWYDGDTNRWRVVGTPSNSLLTVEDVTSSTSFPGITTLQFDTADGFAISNPSPGVARVDFSGGGGGTTGTNGQEVATLTNLSTSWSDVTDATVSLPSAGTYLITATGAALASVGASGTITLSVRLYGGTLTPTTLAGSEHEVIDVDAVFTPTGRDLGAFAISVIVTIGAAADVVLQGILSSASGNGYVASATVAYVKLA